jgi:phosphatidylserine/phosphatidylglycerophosphate/cardiolipin synthase-like enzyme
VAAGAALAEPAEARAWRPQAGVKTNDPLGSKTQRRAIVSQVLGAVRHARPGTRIRVASWNIRSREVTGALAAAHRRGVGVQVVMDRLNANPQNLNPAVERLTRALSRRNNDQRPPALRSGVVRCVSSCRAPHGIAHAKFFLFDRTGRSRDVVMNGSWNATDLATTHQWNDLYTVRGNARLYRAFTSVFDQMYLDQDAADPYVHTRAGKQQVTFFPHDGSGRRDPVLDQLRPVQCHGARSTGGRTRVRIAMTSWIGPRGTAIARRVRRLANHGCDVRIVYGVMGNEVLRILRRGGPRPVPLRQVAQDPDRDGVYDRYLHMKVLTVEGHYGRNRRASLTFNGSANWSPASLASDEAVIRVKGRGTAARYRRWIDHLYAHPPRRR